MRCRIFVSAHAGAFCHRALKETSEAVMKEYYWENQMQDIDQMYKSCMHCIQSKASKIPRPLGNIVKGDKPNEVLHMDFFQMSATGKSRWVLVLTDSFSMFTLLYSVKAVNAIEASKGLQHWCIYYAIPRWITTDKGSAFTADLFHELTKEMKIKHHIIVAYVHTGNAIVERKCRTLKQMVKALTSELQLESEDWPEILGIVQFGINNYRSTRLLGKTPREAYLGFGSEIPLISTYVDDKSIKVMNEKAIMEYMDDYFKTRNEERIKLLEEVQRRRNQLRSRNEKYQQHKFEPEKAEFIIGDYVMIAKHDLQSKHAPTWDGPYKIVDVETPYVYKVASMLNDGRQDVHVSRLIKYNNSLMNSERGIREQAAFNNKGFRVSKVEDFHKRGKEYMVTVRWLGLDQTSEEPADVIYRAAPELVELMLNESTKTSQEKIKFAKVLGISKGAV